MSKDNNIEEFPRLEKGGLDYIRHENNYLFISVFFPIYIIIIQVINMIAIINPNPPSIPTREQSQFITNPPPLIEILTPIIILLVFSVFALINFIYLLSWKKKIHLYHDSDTKSKISLAKIFYDIIKNMKIIRKFLMLLTIIVGYYFLWYLELILNIFMAHYPPPPLQVQVLNILSQIGLVLYLFFEWKHFYTWNKKLKALKELEIKIYKELHE